MFRCSASLAILHRKSFAVVPSVSLVLPRRHTNRNVSGPHESQCEIASCRHFQNRFLTTNRERWRKKWPFVSQDFGFWHFAGRSHRTIRIRIRIAAQSHDTMPLRSQDALKHLGNCDSSEAWEPPKIWKKTLSE